MQMWKTICFDARISISKSMFGLRTTAIFNPTNSIIDANTFEYSLADGERIKHLLDILYEKKVDAIGDFHPKTTVNGNYMVEVCASRDGVFLAVQLNQFVRMSYEPVTEVLIFEGDEAHAVAKLF
jgi:hypothetical protein